MRKMVFVSLASVLLLGSVMVLLPRQATQAEVPDVPSSISVTKTANPTSLPKPGGPVTFTVLIDNTSAVDSVTIDSLVDSIHGDLNGQGDCSVPQTIPAGDYYNCSFTATVSGNAGYVETDVATASGTDDGGNPVSDADDATVVVIGEANQTAPGDTSGINFSLEVGGTISGYVYQEDAVTPIPNLLVLVWDYDSGAGFGGSGTAEDGSYSLVLPSGTYRVYACSSCSGLPYLDEFYDSTYDYDEAEKVTVTASGIDFTLEVGGSIPPVASFNYAPEDPVLGEEIIFDASSSYDPDGEIENYIWDFGDGVSSQEKVVTHTYVEIGEYEVTLQVTDDDDLEGMIEKILIIKAVIDIEFIDEGQLSANNNAGGGLRIFPGKQTPSDTVDRSLVKVRATTTPYATVYFRSFDIDDPSDDVGPVDDNGSAGNDNRGTPQSGVLSAESAQADASGIAEVSLKVNMHPGDNFKVAASCDMEYLWTCMVDGVNLKDLEGNILPTGKAAVTDMLTVWRRFHIELDRMGSVTGNGITGNIAKSVNSSVGTVLTLGDLKENNAPIKALDSGKGRFEDGRIVVWAGSNLVGDFSVKTNDKKTITLDDILQNPASLVGKTFSLVDDDDYNSDDGPSLHGDEGEALVPPGYLFSSMQDSDNPSTNVFADAYIQPTYDEAGVTADKDNVTFDPNVTTEKEYWGQYLLGVDSDVNERDDFWVVYIQLAYQGDEKHDNDPAVEKDVPLGVTYANQTKDDVKGETQVPTGGHCSLLFLETIKEEQGNIDGVAPHEVGHQFGLWGDKPGFGIMDSGWGFVPRHLNVLRWRVKSPGH